ncbi:hypothetical protein ACFLZP_04755, partial [Patescibacteria group bacterium]
GVLKKAGFEAFGEMTNCEERPRLQAYYGQRPLCLDIVTPYDPLTAATGLDALRFDPLNPGRLFTRFVDYQVTWENLFETPCPEVAFSEGLEVEARVKGLMAIYQSVLRGRKLPHSTGGEIQERLVPLRERFLSKSLGWWYFKLGGNCLVAGGLSGYCAFRDAVFWETEMLRVWEPIEAIFGSENSMALWERYPNVQDPAVLITMVVEDAVQDRLPLDFNWSTEALCALNIFSRRQYRAKMAQNVASW